MRGVAAESGQGPYLAETVGEDDAVDVRVEGGPGLLGLVGQAEPAAADRELRGRLREFDGVEGVPLVATQVEFRGLRPVGGRGGGGAGGLGDELVDEAVGGLGVLLDHAAEEVGPVRTESVEQVRPVAVAADRLRQVLFGPRGFVRPGDVEGREDDRVVHVAGGALHDVDLLAAGGLAVRALPGVAARAVTALGAEDVEQVPLGPARRAALPARSAAHRERFESGGAVGHPETEPSCLPRLLRLCAGGP